MPPNGTAGFARSSVSGARRFPAPPARTIPRTRGERMPASCRTSVPLMRIGVLTREWPDEVYGGAGVHVEHLVRSLRDEGAAVDVHSFGGTRDGAQAHTA